LYRIIEDANPCLAFRKAGAGGGPGDEFASKTCGRHLVYRTCCVGDGEAVVDERLVSRDHSTEDEVAACEPGERFDAVVYMARTVPIRQECEVRTAVRVGADVCNSGVHCNEPAFEVVAVFVAVVDVGFKEVLVECCEMVLAGFHWLRAIFHTI